LTESGSILKKVIRNKPAIVALVAILITIIVAIFAYPIAPDGSPDANNMIVELSARPAGYRQQLLLVPKQHMAENRGFISHLFSGTPEQYNYIPVNGYTIRDTILEVRHYIDAGLEDTLYFSPGELGLRKTEMVTDDIRSLRIRERKFYLGTDRYGRDILSRLLIGARVSMAVGFVSVILSLSIGILLGSLAGWYGGFADDIVMWIINILWSIPTLLLVFAITLTLGKGFWEIFIAIGLTSWVSAARLIRGQVMQLREMDYITAARALGFSDIRIIFRHILPNIAGPLMVIAAANFATAILIEAGLSFLGIGVQPPTPSWGLMIKEHYNFLIAGNPFPALIPGAAIMMVVFAFNIIGNALRDAIDVR